MKHNKHNNSSFITNKEAEEIKEYLENIIALMPGHVYWKDKTGTILGCNDLQAKSAGFSSRQELIGKTDYDLPWRKQADALRKIDLEVMKTGKAQTIEELSTLADGTESVFLSQKVPLYHKGEITGILGVSFDITDRKRTEKELRETRHKLEGMTLVSAAIAHELRTPFATINISNENLKSIFPHLIQAYRVAREANLPLYPIRDNHLKIIESGFESIETEIKSANNFIDMLLMNVNTAISNNLTQTGQFLITECINKALSRYPFKEHQRKFIFFNQDTDFLIKGNQDLIEHVLFNLIKNALYYIAAASKDYAHIEIWLEKSNAFNKLYFKDTGTGIDPDILPHIFEQFFSRTHHGAGIGLTFCKMVMESLGGSISCESEKGNYTQFILLFPSINN